MKKNTKIIVFLSIIAFVGVAFGKNFSEYVLRIGDGLQDQDTFIYSNQIGSDDPFVKYDSTDDKWKFSDDGVNEKTFGSGSGGGSGVNLLSESNADFESGTPSDLFSVVSGGGVLSTESAQPLFGQQSSKWDAGISGDSISSAITTIPNGMVGGTCAVSVDYKFDGGTEGDIILEVDTIDGGTTVAVSFPLPPTTLSKNYLQFFSCPKTEGGQVQFRIRATTDAAILVVDNVFVGSGKESVSHRDIKRQSTYLTSGDRVGAGDIGSYSFSSTRSEGDGVLSHNVAAGIVDVLIDSWVTVNGAVNSLNGSVALIIKLSKPGSDSPGSFTDATLENCGATTFDCSVGWSGFLDAGSQIKIYSSNTMNGGKLFVSAEGREQKLSESINVETSGNFWSGYINKGSEQDLGLTSTSGGDQKVHLGSALLDLTNLNGNAKITCAPGTLPEGTNCNVAAVSEIFGIAITPYSSGNHEVCFKGWIHTVSGAAKGMRNLFYIDHQTTAGVQIEEGQHIRAYGDYDSASGSHNMDQTLDICNTFNVAAGSETQFVLRLKRNIYTGAPVTNQLRQFLTNGTQKNLTFTVRNLDQQMPSPVFTEVKTSIEEKITGGRANLVVRACKILSGGSVTFDSATNYCEDWVTSVTRSVTGNHVLNFMPGVFSQTPVCVGSSEFSSGGINGISVQAATTSSLQILTKNGALINYNFTVLCYGQK